MSKSCYKYLEPALLLVDQHVSLIVCHELFLCVVVVRQRKYSRCRLIGKVLLGVGIIAILEGITPTTSYVTRIDASTILKAIYSVRFCLIMVITLVTLVYGFKIIRSLIAARQFHAGVGRAFVSGLVASLLIGQITKFILITTSNVREYLSLKILSDCSLENFVACLWEAFLFHDADYISAEYGCVVELFFALVVRVLQRIHS